MTSYQRETYEQVIDEIQPLLWRHWKEIAHFQDIPLAPNWDGYKKAESAGTLRIYTARRVGLVGYGVFFMGSLHYCTSRLATQDIFFVAPECRGIVGARLLQFCDEQLKAEGAQAVYHHVKKAHDFGPVLKRMGYEAVDVVYGRRF